MIKANELRLENLVLYKGEILPIYNIDRAGLSFSRINDIPVNKNSGATLQTGEIDFEPILLTPEWLERMGFIFYKRDNSDYSITCEGGDVITWDSVNGQFDYNFANIYNSPKYVHQLQNLY